MAVIDDYTRQLARDAFADRMVDAVLIQRGGLGATDPDTLETVGMLDPVTVYTGPGRCGKASGDAQVSLGEGEIATRSMGLDIPFDAAQVQVNDLVTVTAAVETKLVGTSWRVTGVDGGGSWNVLTNLTLSGWFPSSFWTGE